MALLIEAVAKKALNLRVFVAASCFANISFMTAAGGGITPAFLDLLFYRRVEINHDIATKN